MQMALISRSIQGLINGLAGKFLTSIVGLLCANVFVLLEVGGLASAGNNTQQRL